jgi:hypothetical protein
VGLEARVAESTTSSKEVFTDRAGGDFRSVLDKRRVFQSICLDIPDGTDKLDESWAEVFEFGPQRHLCER